MEKKISTIKDFVKTLEESQVIKENQFKLFSGGTSSSLMGEKNKHNSRCCNSSIDDPEAIDTP